MRNRLYSLDQVQVGIDRVLAAYRESLGTDVEPEFKERVVRMVPVVFNCESCGRYYHPIVLFENDDPTVSRLPENCACGRAIDTYETIRDLIGTARLLVETAWARRGLLS